MHEKQQRNTLTHTSFDTLVFTGKAIRDGECNTREHAGHYILCYTHITTPVRLALSPKFSLLILPVAKATFFLLNIAHNLTFFYTCFCLSLVLFTTPYFFPPGSVKRGLPLQQHIFKF